MTVSASLLLALMTFICGVGVALMGYFVRQMSGIGKRTGQLEQVSAGQAQSIRSLEAGFVRIESKLDRVLERPYRGEMPSQVDPREG